MGMNVLPAPRAKRLRTYVHDVYSPCDKHVFEAAGIPDSLMISACPLTREPQPPRSRLERGMRCRPHWKEIPGIPINCLHNPWIITRLPHIRSLKSDQDQDSKRHTNRKIYQPNKNSTLHLPIGIYFRIVKLLCDLDFPGKWGGATVTHHSVE